MIATAPGKLIVTGEYAVLDGAPALVVAVNRRVVARRHTGPRGSSPFLIAVADTIARRYGADHPAARAALEIVVNSTRFFYGAQKLGLGSSAAVTVAATALALAAGDDELSGSTSLPAVFRDRVADLASTAHATAQSARGARGSGADIAAAVYGGVIVYSPHAVGAKALRLRPAWPDSDTLLPFFTGSSADTPKLVAQVAAAREANRAAVDAALLQIAAVSRAACQACAVRSPALPSALIAALTLAGHAIDQLAAATKLPLVPACVHAVREALRPLGGTAKTTGAGGGDVAIAVIPGTEDVTVAQRLIIEAGCKPLNLSVDATGVDLQPDAA